MKQHFSLARSWKEAFHINSINLIVMDQQVNQLFQTLHGMSPVSGDRMRSSFEWKMTRITWVLRGISLALFLLLFSLALWIHFVGTLHGFWQDIAIVAGLGSMAFAMLGLILDTLPSFLEILNLRNKAFRHFQLEIQHDSAHVAELLLYKTEVLERARQWLTFKIERIKDRLGIFLGGADKVALFALATMGWSAWKEFSELDSSWEHDLFLYGAAFLCGITIGGVFLNAIMQRYSYHRDLIDLALDHQRKGEILVRFHTVPRPTFTVRLTMYRKRIFDHLNFWISKIR